MQNPTVWFQSLNTGTQILVLYLLLINIITFFYFAIDKLKSTSNNNVRRIPEKTLWLLCLSGGSLGGLLAMKLVRHKTKKLSFQAVLALILAAQIGLVYWLLIM